MEIQDVLSKIKTKPKPKSSNDIEEWTKRYKKASLRQIEQFFYFKEESWRLEKRNQIKNYVLILLAAQNFAVFFLLYITVWNDTLKGIQVVIGIVIPATLTETAFCFRIIVNYLFNNKMGHNNTEIRDKTVPAPTIPITDVAR